MIAKAISWIQHAKTNSNRRWKQRFGDKDGKMLYQLMNNAVYHKTMAKLRNRIDVKFESNRKGYLKWTSKPRYMS